LYPKPQTITPAADEGLRRAAFFWSTAVPVYIHYQIVDKMTIKWPEAKRKVNETNPQTLNP
jgi:hypothetical protein